MDINKIENAVKDILVAIGENPEREGLKQTPTRIAAMYKEIFYGINKNPEDYIEVFKEEKHEELVLVKDIPFYSICEHHFLPFYGKAHIAYIPKEGRITGFSKLVQVMEVISARPQLQERIVKEVADTLMKALSPHGVAVVIEAEQMCMSIRGIKKPGSVTVTSAMRGAFMKSSALRQEFLSLIKG